MFSDIFVRVAFYHPASLPARSKPHSHHPCGHIHHFTDCALDRIYELVAHGVDHVELRRSIFPRSSVLTRYYL